MVHAAELVDVDDDSSVFPTGVLVEDPADRVRCYRAALTSALRNHQVGAEALDAILPATTLNDFLIRLGSPRASPFSLDQARQACAELADQAARQRSASDVASIATAIVKVVRAFV